MKQLLRNNATVGRLAVFVLTMMAMATAAAAATPLGKLLVDFESHVKWEAVDEGWKGMRDKWTEETTACEDATCVARQLAVLEEHTKWEAVAPDWKAKRPGWVAECKSAKTDAEVNKLMLSFEETLAGKLSMKIEGDAAVCWVAAWVKKD